MALAKAFSNAGHSVIVGVRNPQDKQGREFTIPAAAAANSEIVVLATPFKAARQVVESLGDLTGKILIDCTNPLKEDLSGLDLGLEGSGAQQIAALAVGADVIKAFNHTGANNMENVGYGAQKPVMMVCGDSEKSKKVVLKLASELGFDPLDAGPLSAARWLEHLAMLWIHLAFRTNLGREFSFAVLRR
jgi:hypothetical protein